MKTLLFLSAILGSLVSFSKEKKLVLHPNGKVQFEYEVEGFKMDGKFVCYYENGKLKVKGQFIANQKTGSWRFWDEKGLLRVERNYLDNLHFTVTAQWDSSGTKIKPAGAASSDFVVENLTAFRGAQTLFNHRTVSIIEKEPGINDELFGESGLAGIFLSKVQGKEIAAFVDDKFVKPVNVPGLSCYSAKDIVSFFVKEDIMCVNLENPVMIDRLTGICAVVMEKGVRKELGWIYVPDLGETAKDIMKAVRDDQYKSIITKTTINDPAFKLRDVSVKENESIKLALLEFEAGAILYSLDNNFSLATNQ